MSTRLEAVIEKIRQLPETDQAALVSRIEREVEEFRADRRWDDLLAQSPETLQALADEAERARGAGETEEMTKERLRRGS